MTFHAAPGTQFVFWVCFAISLALLSIGLWQAVRHPGTLVFLRLALTVVGVGGSQDRVRIVTRAVLGATAVLLARAHAGPHPVPRVRRPEVQLPRLGAGLGRLRVVLTTDTHYDPLDRARNRFDSGLPATRETRNA